MPVEDLARALAAGHLSVDFIDSAFLRPVAMVEASYRDLARELGVTDQFGEAFQVALGVASRSGEEWIREGDVDAMKAPARLVALGVDEAVAVRLLRIMADKIRRMARATGEMWSAGVRRPLRKRGVFHRQLLGARSADSAEFQGGRLTLFGGATEPDS